MMACPPPETLSAVFDLAVRASALEVTYHSGQLQGNDRREDKHRKFTKVSTGEEQRENRQSNEEGGLFDYQRLVEDQRRVMNVLESCRQRLAKTELALAGCSSENATAKADTSNPTTHEVRGHGGRAGRSVAFDVCRKCGEKGHWARECPLLVTRKRDTTGRSKANALMTNSRPHRQVYIQFVYEGQFYRALLDTGCDISVMGAHVLPGISYQECSQKLYAANLSAVPIVGSTELKYAIGGVTMRYELSVSDEIDEIVFGVGWLTDHRCVWDFEQGKLYIRDGEKPRPVSLWAVNRRPCIRRIYAKDTTEIPSRSQVDLPVKSIWSTLPPKAVDWLAEPRELRTHVIAARTLLSTEGQAHIRVVNCGSTDCTIQRGDLIATAEVVGRPKVAHRDQTADEDTAYEHVQCLIDDLPDYLDQQEKEKATEFIRRHVSVFPKSATDLGRNRMRPHRIDTGDHQPIKEPMRRHPYAHIPIIESNVQELLAAKVIEPAASPWASNVLLVRKKDGTWRFCVDYRKLNDVTRKEAYPLPRIDSCLESLGGPRYFSTLDLRAGYWQTELAQEDANKTAFVTRSGQYRLTVLSMGLANAPSHIQRLMDIVLASLLWKCCLVFLDDIIVYSTTFDQHLERLAAVFDCLAKADLKMKASKCQLFRESVRFLGHVVSAQGIAADPEKVKTVASWPLPRNLQEVRSFVGLASYYRRFIAGFADIARPLHILIEKGRAFVWESAQEEAFQTLKDKLTSAPILASPQDLGQYILDTDASSSGLGAVLQQRQNGEIRMISYASRTLSRAERNYSTTRRELLAVIFGFKQF
jgi:predicted aspartyl protease